MLRWCGRGSGQPDPYPDSVGVLERRESDHRPNPLSRVYRAHRHAPNSSAHHPAHQLSLFVSFAYFAVVNSTAHRSAGRGKITTAKDTKYAKVEATERIRLERGPSWNPATVRDSKASTAINEDAGKPKARIDLRAHQSFVPTKTSTLESFFIQRTSRITRSEGLSNHCPRDTRGLGVHPLVRQYRAAD